MSEPIIVVCPHCDAANRIPAERLTDGGTCGKCKTRLFAGEPLELNAANFDTRESGGCAGSAGPAERGAR